MSFWSSEKLKVRISADLINPCDLQRIKHGAYELSLGHEAFVTSDDKEKKRTLDENEQLVIPPGQFGLLLTEEEIQIPGDTIGFISIKAGIKFRGLVNVSGFHVDPGFSGKLKFSVYNAGSQNIILTRNQPVFLIWFSDLDQPTSDIYHGDHANQKDISSEDVMRIQGKVHSPASLDMRLTSIETALTKRISVVEGQISTINKIAIGIVSTLIIGILSFSGKIWSTFMDNSESTYQEKPGTQNREIEDAANTPLPMSDEPIKKKERGVEKAKDGRPPEQATKPIPSAQSSRIESVEQKLESNQVSEDLIQSKQPIIHPNGQGGIRSRNIPDNQSKVR